MFSSCLLPKSSGSTEVSPKAVWRCHSDLALLSWERGPQSLLFQTSSGRWWSCQSLGAYWSPKVGSIYKDTLWPACSLKTQSLCAGYVEDPSEYSRLWRLDPFSGDHSKSVQWRRSGKPTFQFLILLLRQRPGRIPNSRERNLVSISVGSCRHFTGAWCASERRARPYLTRKSSRHCLLRNHTCTVGENKTKMPQRLKQMVFPLKEAALGYFPVAHALFSSPRECWGPRWLTSFSEGCHSQKSCMASWWFW